jgi:hypothetical protein
MIVYHHSHLQCNQEGHQGLQEKFSNAEQDCFGVPGQAETSLKIEDLRANKPTCNEMMAFLVTL